jgi:hypothetical protein
MGSQNLEGNAYYLHTTSPIGPGGDSFGATAAMPNDLWNIPVSAREVDEAFNPAVGFVTRRGYRRYQPSVEYGPAR